MSKRTIFTTVTSLPPSVTRDTVMETLRNHVEMIDLNPLVIERHPIKPPKEASAEEYHCVWYEITDKVAYIPGNVVFKACFHDLPLGLQTHIYAPAGLDIKGKWTLGGSLPGEPRQPQELGVGMPKEGLWLREDVDMRCNFLVTGFVKKSTVKAHGQLVDRLVEKAQLRERDSYNARLVNQQRHISSSSYGVPSQWPESPEHPPSDMVGGTSPYQSDSMSFRSPMGSPLMDADPAFNQAYRQSLAQPLAEKPAPLRISGIPEGRAPPYEQHPSKLKLPNEKPPVELGSYNPKAPVELE